jgi:hypothetical protein
VISGRTASASLPFALGLTVELGAVVVDTGGAGPNCQLSITRTRKTAIRKIEINARIGTAKKLSSKGIECRKRAL